MSAVVEIEKRFVVVVAPGLAHSNIPPSSGHDGQIAAVVDELPLEVPPKLS